MRLGLQLALLVLLPFLLGAASPVTLDGQVEEGGLVIGRTVPGATVTLDGETVRVDAEGRFLIGFHRDAPENQTLTVRAPDGAMESRTLKVKQREYDIQRIDGLPGKMVTPPPEVLERIKAENEIVARARAREIEEPHFLTGWQWPAQGIVSGVYGSQRILNGEPRQPHYGVDVAAPVGTPVLAPADGVVTMVHPDMYYTGATIILDHGYGLSSTFLHLDRIDVEEGQTIAKGSRIGTIGASGRATGAHLDWRMNLFEKRLDPAFLVPPMTAPEVKNGR